MQTIEGIDTEKAAEKAVFGLVGSGWRAEFYLRIAQALPGRFEVCGVVTRRAERARELAARFGVRVYASAEEMLAHEKMLFAVVSVRRDAAPGLIGQFVSRGVPVLTETPPAQEPAALAELCALVSHGAKIQVAEQYHLQPLHAARLKIASSGMLGEVTEAQISACHDYHAISLLRRLLGVGFDNCHIRALHFVSRVTGGPGRDGPPEKETANTENQVIASLDFGGKLAVYDFSHEQYFSWIRALRCLIRGEKGEICDKTVRYLPRFDVPVQAELTRMNTGEDGNLEGYSLRGILLGSEWVYRSPFAGARLSDDELAVADCLARMAAYASGGPEFYSVREAAQDQYLSLKIAEAASTGETVSTVTQPWAE